MNHILQYQNRVKYCDYDSDQSGCIKAVRSVHSWATVSFCVVFVTLGRFRPQLCCVQGKVVPVHAMRAMGEWSYGSTHLSFGSRWR